MSAEHEANIAALRRYALAGSEVALDALLFCTRLEEQASQTALSIARLKEALADVRRAPEVAPTQRRPGVPS